MWPKIWILTGGMFRAPWIPTALFSSRSTGANGSCRDLTWIFMGISRSILHGYKLILNSLLAEGSFEVKLPTIWRDEKAVSREKSQKRKDQKKEDAGARKGRKVAKHCVFPMICGSGGSKSTLAKAAGAETSGEIRDEKLHAVVARSRFRSEKAQNT